MPTVTRMVAERVAGLAHSRDEARARGEVVHRVAGMKSLTELAPVGEVGSGDLLAREHVHGHEPSPRH